MTIIANLTKYIIIFCVLLMILILIVGGIAYYLLKVRKITSKEEQFDYSRFDRRDSVEFLRFNQIVNATIRGRQTDEGMIIYENGDRFVAGIKVYGFNFFSSSAQEQYSSISGMISFLNTIEKDVQYRQSTKAIDLGENINKIREKIEQVNAEVFALDEDRKNMLEVLDSYRHEPKTYRLLEHRLTQTERAIKCKSHTVDELEELIRYMEVVSDNNFETEKVQCWFIEWVYNSNEYTDALTQEEKYEKAAEALATKTMAFSNALSSTGCTCERMTGEELLDAFRHHYMPETADVYKMSDLYDSTYNTLFVTSNVLEELEEEMANEEAYKEYLESYEELKRRAQAELRGEVEKTVESQIKEDEKAVSFASIDISDEDDIVMAGGGDTFIGADEGSTNDMVNELTDLDLTLSDDDFDMSDSEAVFIDDSDSDNNGQLKLDFDSIL